MLLLFLPCLNVFMDYPGQLSVLLLIAFLSSDYIALLVPTLALFFRN